MTDRTRIAAIGAAGWAGRQVPMVGLRSLIRVGSSLVIRRATALAAEVNAEKYALRGRLPTELGCQRRALARTEEVGCPVPKNAGRVQHYPGARTSPRLCLGREPWQHCYTVNPHGHVAVAAAPSALKSGRLRYANEFPGRRRHARCDADDRSG
jgi:hypothetical protein